VQPAPVAHVVCTAVAHPMPRVMGEGLRQAATPRRLPRVVWHVVCPVRWCALYELPTIGRTHPALASRYFEAPGLRGKREGVAYALAWAAPGQDRARTHARTHARTQNTRAINIAYCTLPPCRLPTLCSNAHATPRAHLPAVDTADEVCTQVCGMVVYCMGRSMLHWVLYGPQHVALGIVWAAACCIGYCMGRSMLHWVLYGPQHVALGIVWAAACCIVHVARIGRLCSVLWLCGGHAGQYFLGALNTNTCPVGSVPVLTARPPACHCHAAPSCNSCNIVQHVATQRQHVPACCNML
jgi:hypothetical protein